MAKQQEVLFNKVLAKVLREIIAKDAGGSTDWDLVDERYVPVKYDLNESGEEKPPKKEKVKPDILFKPAGEGLEVIIETEFDPAETVEADAKERFKQGLELHPGTVIYVKRVFALCIDESFKEESEISLERKLRQENEKFSTCFFADKGNIKRTPTDDWAQVSLTKLATMVREPEIERIEAQMFFLSILASNN